MENNILGIGVNLDLRDLKTGIENIIKELNRFSAITESTSKKLNDAFSELGNEADKDFAQKAAKALETLKEAVNEANNAVTKMPEELKEASKRVAAMEKTFGSLEKQLQKLREKRGETIIGSDEFNRLNSEIRGVTESMGRQSDALNKAREEVNTLNDGYIEAIKTVGQLEQIQQHLQQRASSTTATPGAPEFGQRIIEANNEIESTAEHLEDVKEEAHKAAEETKNIGTSAKQAAGESEILSGVFSKLKSLAATIGIGVGLEQFASRVMKTRGEFQKLEVAFETMLGDEAEAKKLFNQLVDTAAKTPFDLQGVASGAKQLLAYGTSANKVNDTLIRLGDIAAGLSLPLNDLVYLYGTTMVQGRLFAQDMRQFTGRGIPLADELAKQFGVTSDEINELVTAGKIGFPEVEKAIISLTNEGGKFGGLMQKQSETISGQISNIQDSVATMFNEIGKSSEGVINAGLSLTSKLVENYEAVGKSVLTLISMYGTYKAAVITATAVHKAEVAGLAVATTAQKAHAIATMTSKRAMDLLNKSMLNNPIVLATMAIVGLTTAVIAFSKSSSVAADRAKEFADREREQAEEIENKTNKIKQSLDAIKDENLSERERQNILVELKQMMPSVFGQYDTWIELQKNLKQATEEANATLARQKQLQTGENITSDFEMIKKWRRYRELMDKPKSKWDLEEATFMSGMQADKNLWSSQGTFQTTGSYIDQQIKALSDRIEQTREAARKAASTDFDARTSVMNALQLNEQIRSLEQMKLQQVDGYIYLPDEIAPVPVSEVERRIEASNKRLLEIRKNNDADYLTDEKKRIEELERKRKQIIADRNKTDENGDKIMTPEQYEAALKKVDEDLEAARTTYKKRGGSESSKDDVSRQNNELAKQKLLQRQKDQQTAYEAGLAERQAEIDGLKDGAAKEIKQMQLDHDRRMAEIKRQEQEYKNANTEALANEYDKKHSKDKNAKGFYSRLINNELTDEEKARINLTSDQQKIIESLTASENAAFIANQEKIEDGLIKQHQSYTDRKLEIDKNYKESLDAIDAAISEAEKRGDVQRVESLQRSRLQATKDYQQQQTNLSFEELKKSPDYIRAYEDLNNTSTETLQYLISQFEKTKEGLGDALSPEELREYTSTLQQMYDVLNQRNPYKALSESATELQKAERALDGAKLLRQMAEKAVADAKATGSVEALAKAEERLKQAQENERRASDNVEKSRNKHIKATKEALNRINELATAIDSLGNSIGGTQGEILSIISGVMSFTTMAIEGIQKVAQQGANALKAIEKASVILTIVSAGVQIIQKINSILKDSHEQYERYADKIGEVNRLRDAVYSYQSAILKAQQAEKNWFASSGLERLREAAETSYQALDRYFEKIREEQATYQNESGGGWLTKFWNGVWDNTYGNIYGKIESYNKETSLAIDNLRIETRKKSSGFLGTGIGGRSQKTEDLRTWVKTNFGEDLFDEDNFIKASLAQEIIDKYGDKLVGETKQTIEALISLKEEYEKYDEQLKEYVSDMFSPLLDNLADSLWDWLKDGKNVMDSFKEYASETFSDVAKEMLKKLLINDVFDQYREQLKEVYQNYGSGTLTDEQLITSLMKATDVFLDNAEQKIPTMQKLVSYMDEEMSKRGFDISGREKSSTKDQTATANLATKVTYEQADNIESRLTAIQITGQHSYEQLVMQTEIQREIQLNNVEIKVNTRNIDRNVESLLDISRNSERYLQRIAVNTDRLNEMSDELTRVRKIVENQ